MRRTFTHKGYGRIFVRSEEDIEKVKNKIKEIDEFEFSYLPTRFIATLSEYPALVYIGKFDDLDLDSRLESSITIIEWGDGFVERLTDEYLEIAIAFGGNEGSRTLSFNCFGERWNGFSL